eukprot:Amastigsp_a850235_7.p1 type:complete len:449 gc:universal Amastigsp_a850235_7:1416-70(-)
MSSGASSASGASSSSSVSGSAASSSGSAPAPTSGWLDACAVGERVQVVSFEDLGTLAIFEVDGKYYAVDDKCCHGKGRLSGGDIEDLGSTICEGGKQPDGSRLGGLCIRCPKHHHKFGDRGLYFNLENGRSFVPKLTEHYKTSFAVRAFETLVSRGRVFVRATPVLSPEEARQSSSESALDEAVDVTASAFFLWTLASDPQPVNRDSILMTFTCPRKRMPSPPSDLGDAWHVTFRARIEGHDAPVDRDYTPISSLADYAKGRLQFVVKVYRQGVMTQYLSALRSGASLLVSAPMTTLDLRALFLRGLDKAEAKAKIKKGLHLGVVVGGTGVTPALQLLDAAAKTKGLFASVSVIDSNHTEEDVLCRAELGAKAARAKAHVVHTLTGDVPAGWKGERGRVSKALLDANMPKPSSRSRIVVSGPQSMNDAVAEMLGALGHDSDAVIQLEA